MHNLPFGVYRLSTESTGFQPNSSLVEVRSEIPKVMQVTLGIEPIGATVEVTPGEVR